MLALFLGHAAFAATRHPLDEMHRISLSSVRWPQQGQGALVLGNGRPAAGPREQPAPIASRAKVMTAYLTLARYPVSGAQNGFTITVTAAEAQAEAQDAAQDESLVAVRAGEVLTERQLQDARLIPSATTSRRCSPPGWRAARRALSPR